MTFSDDYYSSRDVLVVCDADSGACLALLGAVSCSVFRVSTLQFNKIALSHSSFPHLANSKRYPD